MRGLYKLGENKGKKERRRCGEQISVALAYDLREKGDRYFLFVADALEMVTEIEE